MSNVAEGKRTGHGFAGLRKRYVRRAEFLTTDRTFLAETEKYRKRWRKNCPSFPLSRAVAIHETGMPMPVYKAHRDYERRRRELSERLDALDRERNRERFERAFAEWRDSFWGEAPYAYHRVKEIWTRLHRRFFSIDDFPNPFTEERFPTARFLTECLLGDPRTIDDVDRLFPEFSLEPVPTLPYVAIAGYLDSDDDRDFDTADPDNVSDWLWHLPLYPGITEADIRKAAPLIIRRVNEIYAGRTARARTVELRRAGLTHREIANRLGLTEPTVADTLRDADISTPENA